VDIYYSETSILGIEGGGLMNLNGTYVKNLCAAYFQLFYCVYPILESRQFYSERYEGSALVLLVLALGSLA
jgi:hypothetical protein